MPKVCKKWLIIIKPKERYNKSLMVAVIDEQ